LISEPQKFGSIHITIKTQIQTNRRTNIYLDCTPLAGNGLPTGDSESTWPEGLIGKKMPVFYYPPLEETMHDQLKSIEEPSQLWLTEMLRYYYGTSTYLEVQFWLRTPDGKMQLIQKCSQHPLLIKMSGHGDYEEKAVSHEEVKWHKNTMIFGVNFNCTRTCFKSEMFVFVRLRHGNMYMESQLTELPFRRSEKRKSTSESIKKDVKTKEKDSKKRCVSNDAKSIPLVVPTSTSVPNLLRTASSSILLNIPKIEKTTPSSSTTNNIINNKDIVNSSFETLIKTEELPSMTILNNNETSNNNNLTNSTDNGMICDDHHNDYHSFTSTPPQTNLINEVDFAGVHFNEILNLDFWNPH